MRASFEAELKFLKDELLLLGNLVEQQFLVVGDWQFGSAISIVMMVMILLSMWVLSRFESREEGGTSMW